MTSRVHPGLRNRAAIGAAALCLALAATSVFAGWENDYKAGRAALDAGKPGEAIKHLRDAIADQDREKAAAIKASGMFFEPYLPHYYLGLALFQKREFQEALAELDKSESMKVIQRYPDQFNQLQQTRTLARTMATSAAPAQPAPPPPSPPIAQNPPPPAPTAPPGPAAGQAEPPAARPTETGPKPPATAQPMTPKPSGPDPALVAAVNGAAVEIAKAQKLKVDSGRYLEESEKSRLDSLVSEIRSAPTAAVANQRRQDLTGAIGDLGAKAAERKREEESKARDEQARQAAIAKDKALRDAMTSADPAIRDAESFASANRAALQAAESQRLADRISAVRNARTPDAVNGGATALRNEVASLRRSVADRSASTSKVSQQQYSTGLAAYYAGRYDDALPLLQQAAAGLPKDPDLQAAIGSALYRKYLLGRSQDAGLKSQAEQAFRAALLIRRDYSLDAKAYPPKVVAFFREVASKR